jgi:hypothetical protein
MFFATALPSLLLLSTRPWIVAANGRDQQPSAPSQQGPDAIYNDQNMRVRFYVPSWWFRRSFDDLQYFATVVVGGQSMFSRAYDQL